MEGPTTVTFDHLLTFFFSTCSVFSTSFFFFYFKASVSLGTGKKKKVTLTDMYGPINSVKNIE